MQRRSQKTNNPLAQCGLGGFAPTLGAVQMGIVRQPAPVFEIGEQVCQLPGTCMQGLGRGLRHRLQDRLGVWGGWQHQLPAGLQHRCCQR